VFNSTALASQGQLHQAGQNDPRAKGLTESRALDSEDLIATCVWHIIYRIVF
jgi:hypothetical protein